MNPRNLICTHRGRALILALVASLAIASLGRAIFSAAPAGAVIAENDCIEYDDSRVECEEGGGGGGGDGGWEEGGGWSDEGGEGGGGLTPEEEESVEIESGDDGKTSQEREEAAEEQQKEDEEFEKEWQEEIEEEEKTTAQRQQDRIEALEKKRKEELLCRNLKGQEFHDCTASHPPADVDGLRRRCEHEAADLRRDQRRGRAGTGGMQEVEMELCFAEVIEGSTLEHCNEISAERDSIRGSGRATTSTDEELISCLEHHGTFRQNAMEKARKLRELQERKKGKKGRRTRARH
jgi:hypothetical protein